MTKYIQLKDSYYSKKGDLWKSLMQLHTDISDKIYENTRTIERLEEYQLQDKEWFAPYEEKKQYARSWEELDSVEGHYISVHCNINNTYPLSTFNQNKNIYATENQAKSALAEAQLSQLLKQIYDGENWKPVFNGKQNIFCISCFEEDIKVQIWSNRPQFLAFPTRQLAEQFLENHRDLIKIYFSKYNW